MESDTKVKIICIVLVLILLLLVFVGGPLIDPEDPASGMGAIILVLFFFIVFLPWVYKWIKKYK